MASLFYFSGLSLRKTYERSSSCFYKEREIMYKSILNWIQQKYRHKKIFERKKKIEEFIIDESLIINGSDLITIELESKEILGIS